jgi:hypothetical protein
MTKPCLDDLTLVLTGSRAIQDAENFESKILSNPLPIIDSSKPRDMQEVYTIAKQYGISPENVDKFLALRFPSEERQLQTLKELGAVADRNTINNFYCNSLLNELRIKSPSENWGLGIDGYYGGYELFKEIEKKTIIKKGFIRPREESISSIEKLSVAVLCLPMWDNEEKEGVKIIIRDPFFAEACKDKLIELKKRFSSRFRNYETISTYLNS